MINLRELTLDDLDEICDVDARSWLSYQRTSESVIRKRLNRFPKGFLGAYIDKSPHNKIIPKPKPRLVGLVYGHPVTDFKLARCYNLASWKNFSLSGDIFHVVTLCTDDSIKLDRNVIGTGLINGVRAVIRNIENERGKKFKGVIATIYGDDSSGYRELFYNNRFDNLTEGCSRLFPSGHGFLEYIFGIDSTNSYCGIVMEDKNYVPKLWM